jgi:hypothetical protein
LLAAIDAWEAQGRPHDPAQARRRAESLSLPVFRERIHKLLAEVVTRGTPRRCQHPHTIEPPRSQDRQDTDTDTDESSRTMD